MAIQRLELSPEELASEIGSMTEQQIDELPFGAIQLDQHGTILKYNAFEEQFAKRSRADVVGRNFFSEIAPCTKVKAFQGAFASGVARKHLNEVLDFTFRFPHGTRNVRIRMIYSVANSVEAVWIFVTPV